MVANDSSVDKKVPPLENGDRLSRPEFERRYTATPDRRKMELIEGVVYVASPLHFEQHAEPHSDLIGLLWTYRRGTPGIRLGIEPTIRLDLDNAPQPDGVLFFDQSRGGNCRITEDDYLEGAPEFVAEIAASSVAYDLHDKKRAYRRNGVQEYMIWKIYENELDWFALTEGEYMQLVPDETGIIRSQILPGFWLAVPALLAGNMGEVLAVLQQGLNSSEHADFVKQLSEQD
ncbi:MAG: Uma2 family endonuclease [Lyngbya sp.]|nr:Uma2 family endonuclease [Lyngbya sp.]